MAFSESSPHLNVLNEEWASLYRVRIVHNVEMGIFFINCTNTQRCKDEFKHLVRQFDGTNQCNACRMNYPALNEPPILRAEELSDGSLEDPKLERWIAAWLGVEPDSVGVDIVQS